MDGTAYPADFVTRPISTKVLLKSNFYTGIVNKGNTVMFFMHHVENEQFSMNVHSTVTDLEGDCVIPFEKYT